VQTISREAAIQMQLQNLPWSSGVREIASVRTSRIQQEIDRVSREAAEEAAKLQAIKDARRKAEQDLRNEMLSAIDKNYAYRVAVDEAEEALSEYNEATKTGKLTTEELDAWVASMKGATPHDSMRNLWQWWQDNGTYVPDGVINYPRDPRVTYTIKTVLTHQSDLERNGEFFSMSLIFLVNVLIIVGLYLSAAPAPGHEFIELGRCWAGNAAWVWNGFRLILG
jgi:hypothetical protein